jgi:hypothetical protein
LVKFAMYQPCRWPLYVKSDQPLKLPSAYFEAMPRTRASVALDLIHAETVSGRLLSGAV